MDYSEKLKNPKWQKKRLKIFERDGWECLSCGDKESTLCVHHLKYGKEPWEVDDQFLETLCEDCHGCREAFDNYWGDKGCLPTRFCLHFAWLFAGLFDGTMTGYKQPISVFEALDQCWHYRYKRLARGFVRIDYGAGEYQI